MEEDRRVPGVGEERVLRTNAGEMPRAFARAPFRRRRSELFFRCPGRVFVVRTCTFCSSGRGFRRSHLLFRCPAPPSAGVQAAADMSRDAAVAGAAA